MDFIGRLKLFWKSLTTFEKTLIYVTFTFLVLIAIDASALLRGPAPYYPDWQWIYLYIPTWHKVWAPLLVGILVISLAYFGEKKIDFKQKKQTLLFLLALLFLGTLFNLSITFFSRAGINVLVQRVIDPGNNGYFTTSTGVGDIMPFLETYENRVLGFHQHAQGHPPGAILLHRAITDTVSLFVSEKTRLYLPTPKAPEVAKIWNTLSSPEKLSSILSIGVILFLSNLSAVVVFFIGKSIKNAKIGARAAVISALIPASSYFYPLPDVYFPLFGLVAFLLLVVGVKRNSSWLFVFSGLVFSIGLFFSLSLLPLLLFYLLYIAFSFTKFKKWLRHSLNFTLSFFGTIVLFYILLFIFAKYNFISVFFTVLGGLPENRSYFTWLFYNPYDFFVFTGIPLSLAFLFVSFTTLKQFVKQNQLQTTLFKEKGLISFLAMLTALVLSGTVRGEVGRIWLPFMPFLVLFTLQVLENFKRSKSIYFTILILLIIQTIILQEFWVMLW